MIFLNPTYLWAFLGFAVPIAIHLWSKKEGRTIRIGSIQLLQKSDPKQTSNLKLNEIWLLLLRILVITTLVLILAEPQLKREGGNVPVTYLIEPSLLANNEINSITDTLAENGAVMKLFQPGFPEYDKDKFDLSSVKIPNYWQLATEMQDLETDSIVVFTNAFQSGIKGKRPETGKNINWVIIDPGSSSEGFVYAGQSGNQVELLSVNSDAHNLKFDKQVLPISSENLELNEEKDSIRISGFGKQFVLPLIAVELFSVLIYYEDDFSADMKYIKASFSALSKYLDRPIDIATIQERDFNTAIYSSVIWLSESPNEDLKFLEDSGKPILIYKPDSLANTLITADFQKNRFQLNKRLNAENVLEQHLPEQLFSMFNLRQNLMENVQQYDRRVIDKAEFLPLQTAGLSGKGFSETTDIAMYLWMLLLALLLVERGLAYYRNQ